MTREDWVRIYQALEVSLAITRLQTQTNSLDELQRVGLAMKRIKNTLGKVQAEIRFASIQRSAGRDEEE